MMAQCQQKLLCSHLLSISAAPASTLRAGSTDHSSRPDGQNVTDFMSLQSVFNVTFSLQEPSPLVFMLTHLY